MEGNILWQGPHCKLKLELGPQYHYFQITLFQTPMNNYTIKSQFLIQAACFVSCVEKNTWFFTQIHACV